MKHYLLKTSLLCTLFTACSSKPSAVNEDPTLPILPMAAILAPGAPAAVIDAMSRAPTVAMEGRVVSEGEIPAPLSNVRLGLYKKEKSGWKEITQVSSASDGRFRFTQKLFEGAYEVRVTDSRYRGSLSVHLDSKPVTDLIISASRK